MILGCSKKGAVTAPFLFMPDAKPEIKEFSGLHYPCHEVPKTGRIRRKTSYSISDIGMLTSTYTNVKFNS